MKYISVAEAAKKWGISERSVRNYCALGRVESAFITGKTWNIPEDALKPVRHNNRGSELTLLSVLDRERKARLSGGIYQKIQIELTYNSNHIEGSRLSHEQTRFIFETNTIGAVENVNVDDIIEAANHFRCIDFCIENAKKALTEAFIKDLHRILKTGTSDSRKDWFAVGGYKKLPNQVGGRETVQPENVQTEVAGLLKDYNNAEQVTLNDIIAFHVAFERIHPFQDGNGRVGRLIMFKECLKHDIVPFIIDEYHKAFYYRGLKEWNSEKGFLIETCLSAQDRFKKYLDYFKVPYKE